MALGDILLGLSRASLGAEQGIAERRTLERQALHDRLMEELNKAQIGHLAAQNYRLYNPAVTSRGTHYQPIIDPVTGEISNYDPEQGTVTPSGGRVHPKPQEERAYTPVMGEREKATAASVIIPADSRLAALETADPGLPNRVFTKVAGYKNVGRLLGQKVGILSDEQLERQIEASLNPQEQEYYTLAKQYISGVIPALSGKVVTAKEMLIHGPPLFASGAADPNTVTTKRKARLQRTRGIVREAGRAMDDALPSLQGIDLTPYGLKSSLAAPVPAPAVVPPAGAQPETPPKPSYNPRWWKAK